MTRMVVSEVVVTATSNRENAVSALEMRITIIEQLGRSGYWLFALLFSVNKVLFFRTNERVRITLLHQEDYEDPCGMIGVFVNKNEVMTSSWCSN